MGHHRPRSRGAEPVVRGFDGDRVASGGGGPAGGLGEDCCGGRPAGMDSGHVEADSILPIAARTLQAGRAVLGGVEIAAQVGSDHRHDEDHGCQVGDRKPRTSKAGGGVRPGIIPLPVVA